MLSWVLSVRSSKLLVAKKLFSAVYLLGLKIACSCSKHSEQSFGLLSNTLNRVPKGRGECAAKWFKYGDSLWTVRNKSAAPSSAIPYCGLQHTGVERAAYLPLCRRAAHRVGAYHCNCRAAAAVPTNLELPSCSTLPSHL